MASFLLKFELCKQQEPLFPQRARLSPPVTTELVCAFAVGMAGLRAKRCASYFLAPKPVMEMIEIFTEIPLFQIAVHKAMA